MKHRVTRDLVYVAALLIIGVASVEAQEGEEEFVTLTMILEGTGNTSPPSAPSPGLAYNYSLGNTVELHASYGTDGWAFNGWTGDIDIKESESYHVTLVMDQDRAITAHYAAADWILTMNLEGNGIVYPPVGSYGFMDGDQALVSRELIAGGDAFSEWLGDVPDPWSAIIPYMNLRMTQNRTITAYFTTGDWHVTVTGPEGGCGAVQNPLPGVYAYINERPGFVDAYPEKGCFWDCWTGDVSTKEYTAWFYPASDMTVTPVVASSGYYLNVSSEGEGYTSPTGHHAFVTGRELDIWAVTAGSEFFERWEGDVLYEQRRQNPLHIVMNQDYTLKAIFTVADWYLYIQTSGNGTTEPVPDFYWKRNGDSVTITAIPEGDNLFLQWLGNVPEGEDPSSEEIAVIMDQNRELIAEFVPPEVYIPNLIGLSRSAAEIALTGEGFTLGDISYEYSETVLFDYVIGQTPAPGAPALYGAQIDLAVSLGFCYTEIPDLRGMSQETAETALLEADLFPGQITYAFDPVVAEGHVAAQSPIAGLVVDCETIVDLVLSLGPCTSVIPDLTGLSEDEALAALEAVDLMISTVTTDFHASIPAGHVISQSPAAGLTVSCGTGIGLVISTGSCSTVVPDLSGMTENDAIELLAEQLLFLVSISREYSEEVPEGYVIRNVPESGTEVPCDTGIHLVISLGPCMTTVPNIVGLTQAQGESFLRTYRLVAGVISEEYSLSIPAGIILSQFPFAGTEAGCGAAVNYKISLGPCVVQVPALAGLSLEEAQTALLDINLQPGEVTEDYDDLVPEGQVLTQMPSPGTTVPCETHVDLVISAGPCFTQVPDITGVPLEEALLILEAAHLAAGIVTGESSTTIAADVVLRQNPPAGSDLIACGTAINLVVSIGPVDVCPKRWHTADTNHDYHISAGELLRAIQFYNSGGYHCASPPDTSEDGYLPGPGVEHDCCVHNSDFSGGVPDWHIDLNELLRLIQLYNVQEYGCDPASEDGFSTTPGGCEIEGETEGEEGLEEGAIEGSVEGEGEMPPFFITAGFVNVENLSCISLFRSSSGGDYSSGSPESCRNMKHYFTLVPDADWRLEPVFSPVAGQIDALESETAGSRVEIIVAGYPEYRIIISHMLPSPTLAMGNPVLAGEPLGTFFGDSVNLAVHGPAMLYSYFDLLAEEVFEPYTARGVESREEFIISREDRDDDPLECSDAFSPPRILTEGHLPSWYCFEDLPGEGEGWTWEGEIEGEGEAPPKFITADYVHAENIASISYFRSSAGHSYAEGTLESCRSMKHYFHLYPDVNFHTETIYSPVSGTVDVLRPEGTGTQLEIVVDDYTGYRVHIFHVNLIPTIVEGSHVRAGQPVGTFSGYGTDIAVRGINSLHSYFEVMTDEVFENYQARGITSRSQLVIPKMVRDNDPLECYEDVVPAIFLTHGHLPAWFYFDDLVVEGELEGVIEGEEEGSEEGEIPAGTEAAFAGMLFMWCPPGEYWMGAPEAEVDSNGNERPQHLVQLSQGFWLSKYEITQLQWQTVMGINPAYFKGDSRPVECVSWNRVQEYIQALNEANPGMNFRLPTEAEWEYACRAGTTTRFYWGDDLDGSMVEDYAWTDLDSWGRTHEAGAKLPNPWGLYDMSGNVSEWTQDWYGVYGSDPVVDPAGPETGATRVVRGGNWGVHYPSCRSAMRVNYANPDYGFNYMGFRLAR
ncbi:MAG TPA: PASTA domain-containing protein [Candidatus Hydrogenedentes bacterium]|nr:PASTA domain-containing protein [Candidatus Hydrogenedentota bacterium]